MEYEKNENIDETQIEPPHRTTTPPMSMQEQRTDAFLKAVLLPGSIHSKRAADELDGAKLQTREESASSPNALQQDPNKEGRSSSSDIETPRTISPSPPPLPQNALKSQDVSIANIPSTATSSESASNDHDASFSFKSVEELGPTEAILQYYACSPIRRRIQAKAYIPSHLRHTQTTIDFHRPLSPLTIHDLGYDYSRYYDPFSNSTRISLLVRGSRESTRPSSRPSRSRGHTTATATRTDSQSPSSTPTTKSLNDAETETTMLLIDDRLCAPLGEKDGLGWPLWGDEPEDDDAMHLPHPDDDKIFRLNWKECFTRKRIIPTIGIILLLLGLAIIFIGLPILAHTGIIDFTSRRETRLGGQPHEKDWAWVNDLHYPLLRYIRSGLIDPDTPDYAMGKLGEFGDEYELVFSDEFNTPYRTFYEGDDPYFAASDLWYGATQDLEWYGTQSRGTR